MLHALAPMFIACSAVLGSLLLGGRDRRHGHEATIMLIVCLACAVLGAFAEMT